MKKIFILSSSTGQLGNRLQTAAYFLAAVKKNHAWHLIDCFSGYEDILRKSRLRGKLLNKIVRLITKYPFTQKLINATAIHGTQQSPILLTEQSTEELIARRSVVIITGYFIYSHPDYLNQYSKEVIDQINLPVSGDDQKYVQRSIQPNKATYVGVHIRHGDFEQYRDGEFFYPLRHYERIARSIADKSPAQRIEFIVCSDTQIPDSCFSGLNWTKGPGSILGDMFILSKCDYIFGPRSTFNRWSAFWGSVPRLEIDRDTNDVSLSDFTVQSDLTYPEEWEHSV